MPGGRKMIWVNGRRASVPEDQFDTTLKQLDANGVQFSVDDPSGDAGPQAEMTVGEPEVIKTPSPDSPMQHGASGDWGPDQDMGFMERFANGAKGYAQDFGRAGEGLVRGLNQSLYQGGADEVAAGARAAGGEDFGSALKDEQRQRDQAWNDTPITYGAGRALGYVPGMFVGGPVAKAGATGLQMLKAAAGRVATGAGMAGVNGFLSDDGSVDDRLGAAGRDAAIAAPFGVAGEALTAAGPAMDRAGIALRRANAGGSQPELNAVRQSKGLGQMQTGIDQDFGDLGLASSMRPQSAYDVATKLGGPARDGMPASGMIGDAGRQMGGALDAAGEAGVRGDWDSVRGLMDNSVAKNGGGSLPTVSQRGYAGEMGRIADQELPPHIAAPAYDAELPGNPEFNPNEATPRALQTRKNAFETEGYPREGTVRLQSDAPQAQAYQDSASAVRGELNDTMSGTDFYPDFNQGRETIAKATPIADMAGARAARNKAGSGPFNPFTLGGAVAGGAVGAAGGGIPGMIGGAVAGGAANMLGRNYGQDVAGMGMRGAAAGANELGGLMQAAGVRGAGAMSGAQAQPQEQSQNMSGGLPAETRGYMTPVVAKQMIQQNPMAFGPYAKQFVQAAQNPDESEMVRLLDRLETTDQEWQQNYLPQLLGMTAQQKGGGL